MKGNWTHPSDVTSLHNKCDMNELRMIRSCSVGLLETLFLSVENMIEFLFLWNKIFRKSKIFNRCSFHSIFAIWTWKKWTCFTSRNMYALILKNQKCSRHYFHFFIQCSPTRLENFKNNRLRNVMRCKQVSHTSKFSIFFQCLLWEIWEISSTWSAQHLYDIVFCEIQSIDASPTGPSLALRSYIALYEQLKATCLEFIYLNVKSYNHAMMSG